MKYKNDRAGEPISQLGFGCMRFKKKGRSIDYEKAEKEIMLAVEKGVNYFDTAYIYPGSEVLMGRIFDENGVRDKVKIATKLPQYLTRTQKKIDKIFEEQLERLRTDYIDYYLMHMFTDIIEWERLQAIGIEDWIHKEEGGRDNKKHRLFLSRRNRYVS